jgi:hypothetical protein
LPKWNSRQQKPNSNFFNFKLPNVLLLFNVTLLLRLPLLAINNLGNVLRNLIRRNVSRARSISNQNNDTLQSVLSVLIRKTPHVHVMQPKERRNASLVMDARMNVALLLTAMIAGLEATATRQIALVATLVPKTKERSPSIADTVMDARKMVALSVIPQSLLLRYTHPIRSRLRVVVLRVPLSTLLLAVSYLRQPKGSWLRAVVLRVPLSNLHNHKSAKWVGVDLVPKTMDIAIPTVGVLMVRNDAIYLER